MATVLRDLKDYKQAVGYYNEAADIRLKNEGRGQGYAMVLGLTAGTYRVMGEFNKAHQLLQEAYEIMAQIEGGEESGPCAVLLYSRAAVYKEEGKLEKAVDAMEK